ncbi:hypothetical protein ACTPOK_09345 [Streptomyces inhibens]|uniref:hypothetical protein n=1 Tax=Streptomyces inhibens TaxID=2293571 RepID=UPI00402AE98E
MVDEHGEAANRLAVTCAYLDEIRRDLRQELGEEQALEQVLAAVRDGADLAVPLAALHAVLQAANGDPLGLDGYAGTGSGTRVLQPVGISGLEPVGIRPGERVYVCPAGRCARYWWPQATASVPHCHISDAHLRGERL